MEMFKVESSNISAIGLEGDTLYVEYLNGNKYNFSGVSRELFESFKAAESKGKFFNSNIKGKFTYNRLLTE